MAKTATQIITDAGSIIRSKQTKADISTGTVCRDIGLEGFASEVSAQYTAIDQVYSTIQLSSPDTLDSAVLDGIALNYGLSRKQSTGSTGTVVFGTATKPTATITIGALDGSGGVVVQTSADSTGTAIAFTTTSTVYLTSASTYNLETKLYEVSAPITASTTGLITNVSSDTITILTSTISGVDSVTNPSPLTNGSDQETNAELIVRIKNMMSGASAIGTLAGYTNLVSAQEYVNSVYIVDPDSAYAERGPGCIDIYIDGANLVSISETYTYDGTTLDHVFEKQPVSSIVSVSGTKVGVPHVFIENTDFTFIKDETSIYKYSNYAQDTLRWTSVSAAPDMGTDVTITYIYDQNIETIDSVLSESENHVLTANVLIKEIIPVLINISATVSILPGYDAASVATEIETALTDFITANRLGTTIRQASVISTIENVEGVDYVVVPLTRLSTRTTTGTADLIPAYPYEYWALDASSIAILTT